MIDKFRKQFAAFVFTIIATAAVASCSKNDSKIVGTWKKLNVENNATVTFTEEGDFNFKFESQTGTKATAGTSSGKYEVKGDILRLYDAPPKNGKDTNVKIIKLEDNALILESEVKGEKVQETYEKTGGGVSKPQTQANAKPDVKEVPITEPWASMNLPCQTEGVVVFSDKRRFDCAYGGQKTMERQSEAVAVYTEIFKRDGWKLTSDVSLSKTIYKFEKDGKELFITAKSGSIFRDNKMHEWEGFVIQIGIADIK